MREMYVLKKPNKAHKSLTGIKVNRLTFKKLIGRNKYHQILYSFDCDCGTKDHIAIGAVVKSGKTKSCGCMLRESRLRNISKLKKKTVTLEHRALSNIFNQYRTTARNRGLIFELDWESMREIILQPCFYCNESKVNSYKIRGRESEGEFLYNGIDRVDNLKGYTKENSVPCCRMCNFMKRDFNQDDFLAQVIKITANFKD